MTDKEIELPTYLNSASALMKVCDTPQSKGTPTNSQDRANDAVELGSSLVLGYEFGCGFISISNYGMKGKAYAPAGTAAFFTWYRSFTAVTRMLAMKPTTSTPAMV